ncbi:c-type cytochrome domain-containing protein [Mucilaginibacter sp. SP1R1]|uniref:c-type cytochrome domain-containing protein n=1 Tax=Mucilaginibacter sp. SP1R1 TaxID=2723091 RepID=UPI00160FE032|nr:c-type cytochrome domain-containing protein [Mucilaginibacter sp. SP1R1]MBB6149694.1 putative membrane protein [Mucilaginibacter sp. SP1R1]
MRTSHKGFAEGLLFTLNIFIVVLLLAGDSLVVPQWLQPIGRLHPLILHFPIVILMLAMMLEFFRFRPTFANEKLYQLFTTDLLVLGTLLSSLTVIMGLFLSREPGYEGGTLQWHKWFGVSVAFVGYGIYLWRNTSGYTATIAKTGAIVTIFCLTLAGHFGADLTHGEDFILAPILKKENRAVPIEQALVYQDVIAPIFETKCVSCHNADKMKGGLMLTTANAILKGGKTGKLFIAGQPGISLLLQRIHLPEDEKKHMPPVGKPQLTDQDKLLLYLWIKNNPDFKKKVIELPATDSLRMLAATRLKPAESTEEIYDFSAADDKDIKKLNNNYRVIYALANASPALAVNIYNKSTYSVKVLDELDPIKKQIVILDLNKMPVKDADLKTIGHFENLRQLNLNFSDVTGSGLKALSSLKHLKSLSLAGAKLNSDALGQIMAIKSLTELAIWDTGLKPNDIQRLQAANKKIRLLSGFKDDGKALKLTSPLLKNTSQIFQQSFQLQMSNPIKGTDIRYTTDGSVPDSIKSASYKPGIVFTQNTFLRARAFKSGWLGSDTVQFNFYKNTYTPDSISFLAPADGKYQADGAKTIIDKELGGTNFGNMKWLGSQKDMAILMLFKKPVELHSLTLNTMRNIGSQIFLPAEIEVWGGADEHHFKLLTTLKTAIPQKKDPVAAITLECKLKTAANVSCIKLIIKPLKKVPDWHPAKGKPGWVFADELFLN